MLNPIAFAIPLFFGAIAVEARVARRRGLRVYRFADAIGDLGCGVGNQVVGLLLKGATLGFYAWVFRRFAVTRLAPDGAAAWVLGIVGVDFLYYWWHRLSHEVNALWAAHVVHHQSEDYNLAVALRQALFTGLTGIPFYLPLAVLGVPMEVYVGSVALSLVYQFWIHTEVIGKLGWFEAVFNTPSHHRVHHAINPQYLDRNYAGILIVWDRLFGTFEPEAEPCVYGITKPFGSVDPLWANFHYWAELFAIARRAKGFEKVRTFVRPPGWDATTRSVKLPPFTPREAYVKFEPPPASRGLRRYVNASFAVVAVLTTALLVVGERIGVPPLAAGVTCVVAATVAWAGLIERKPWAKPLELARLVATAGVVAWIAALLLASGA